MPPQIDNTASGSKDHDVTILLLAFEPAGVRTVCEADLKTTYNL